MCGYTNFTLKKEKVTSGKDEKVVEFVTFCLKPLYKNVFINHRIKQGCCR